MKQWVIKVAISLFVFTGLTFFIPVLTANIEQWPVWLKSPHVQFLFNLIVAVIFGFNSGTASVIQNSLKIKGDGNDVRQGTRSASLGKSGKNSARINGKGNKVDQG